MRNGTRSNVSIEAPSAHNTLEGPLLMIYIDVSKGYFKVAVAEFLPEIASDEFLLPPAIPMES